MGRRKIEMVRKEMLTVSLMTDGYPIDGKSKEKTEKMHPEIKKRYIAFAAMAILLIGAVAYFAFSTQTPAKTSQDAAPEVKTQNVQQSAENPAVDAATAETGSYVPMNLPGHKDISLDNMPEKIFLTSQIYLKDFKKQGSYIYVSIGSTADIKDQAIGFVYLDKDGKIIGTQTYGLQFGSKNPYTGQYTFGDSQAGKVSYAKGRESYARIPMPIPEAKYLGIQTIS